MVTYREFDNWLTKGYEGLIDILSKSPIQDQESINAIVQTIETLRFICTPINKGGQLELPGHVAIMALISLTDLLLMRVKHQQLIPLTNEHMPRLEDMRHRLIKLIGK